MNSIISLSLIILLISHNIVIVSTNKLFDSKGSCPQVDYALKASSGAHISIGIDPK